MVKYTHTNYFERHVYEFGSSEEADEQISVRPVELNEREGINHSAQVIEAIGRRAFGGSEWLGRIASETGSNSEEIVKLIFDEENPKELNERFKLLARSVSVSGLSKSLYLCSRSESLGEVAGWGKFTLLRSSNPLKQAVRRISNTEEVFVYDIAVDPGDQANDVDNKQHQGFGTALLYDGLSRYPLRKPTSMSIPIGNTPMEALADRSSFKPADETYESVSLFGECSEETLAVLGISRTTTMRRWRSPQIGDVVDEMTFQFPWLSSQKEDLQYVKEVKTERIDNWIGYYDDMVGYIDTSQISPTSMLQYRLGLSPMEVAQTMSTRIRSRAHNFRAIKRNS